VIITAFPPKLLMRTSGVILHIQAAERAALRCRDLESQHNRDTAGPVLAELRQQSAVAVMLTASSIEAFSNELLLDKVPGFIGLDFNGMRKKQRAFVDQYARPLRDITADPLKYCDAYLGSLSKTGLCVSDPSSTDEPAWALFLCRNALVHFWPEWSGEEVQHIEISNVLNNRFPDSPLWPQPQGTVFPDKYMGFGCARWAVKTAVEFIRSMETRGGLNTQFSQDKMRIDPALL
jgi:hypothetical protein